MSSPSVASSLEPALGPPLRFGVMLASAEADAWVHDVVERLVRTGHGTPALVIWDRVQRSSPLSRRQRLERVPFRLYSKLARRRAHTHQKRSLAPLLERLPSLEIREVRRKRFSEYFLDDDIQAIRDHQLDFILRFGFGILRGEVLDTARHGIWSFHHDDERGYRGSPPCFWPLYDGAPTSGAILQRLSDRLDAGEVLRRGVVETASSYSDNLARVYETCVDWPAQVAAQLRSGHGFDELCQRSSTKAPVKVPPTPKELGVFFGRAALRRARATAERALVHDHWRPGIAPGLTPADLLNGPARSLSVQWLDATGTGRYLADPFVASSEEGRATILVEDFGYLDRKGVITSLEWRDGQWAGEQRAVLEGPAHLSYPFVFEAEGVTYCVPESGAAGVVEVFQHDGARWRPVVDWTIPFPVLDPTIFEHDGRWWLFGTDPSRANHELRIWFASRPSGPWQPHLLSQAKVDIGSSRPAGAVFLHEGRLIRPAQDSSRGYGCAIVFNEILELSPTSFREQPIARLEPEALGEGFSGVHTINFFDGGAVLDGKTRVVSPWTPALRLGRFQVTRRAVASLRAVTRRGAVTGPRPE